MDNEEKQAIIGKAIDTRRGRKNLAWTMTQPISPGMRHPCTGCGHEDNKAKCENIVHVNDEECWYPDGCLAVGGEKKGRKFLNIVEARFPMVKMPDSDVVAEEDKKIFDSVRLMTCPEDCLCSFDEKPGKQKFLNVVTSPFNCDNCGHGFGMYQGSPCWGCSPTAVFNGEPGEVHWVGDGSLVIWNERIGIR